jgi:hypothetical protein
LVQLATNAGPELLDEQVVAVNALPEPAVAAVQLATGTLLVLLVEQLVVVKLLPAVGPDAIQVAMGVGPVVTMPPVDPQVVAVKLLAAEAAMLVHEPTVVGPLALVVQVVLV